MTKNTKQELIQFINDVANIQNAWCDLDMRDCNKCFEFEEILVNLRNQAWELRDMMVLATTTD
jgi:hypothetical protein